MAQPDASGSVSLTGYSQSRQGSTEGGSGFKLTHVVIDNIHFLMGFWTKGLSFLLAVGWGPSSLPCHVGFSPGHPRTWYLISLRMLCEGKHEKSSRADVSFCN